MLTDDCQLCINLFSPCSLSEAAHWHWPHCLWGESCLHPGGQALPCSLWCLMNCARFKMPSACRCLKCLEIKFINSGYFQKTDCWHKKVLWMLITFEIRALATCVIARAFQAEQCTVAVTVATITNTVPSHRGPSTGQWISTYLHEVTTEILWGMTPRNIDINTTVRETWQLRSQTPGDTWQQARGRNIFFSCRLNLNESCLRLDAGDRFEWEWAEGCWCVCP